MINYGSYGERGNQITYIHESLHNSRSNSMQKNGGKLNESSLRNR